MQACTGVTSTASRDPSPYTPRTPRSLRQNQQTTSQHLQQAMVHRRQSLPSHSTKSSCGSLSSRCSLPSQGTPRSRESSRANLPSSILSPMPQAPRTTQAEGHLVERSPGSVAAAAGAAVAAAEAAATVAGLGSERVASPAEGIGRVQGPASLELQRRDCISINGGGMCGNLSARGHAPPDDVQAKRMKARASRSSSPRHLRSSMVDARESCAGRIDTLKSELDRLRNKTGTIRQQLQHFKASQNSLLSHSTAKASVPCEPRFFGGSPMD